MRLPFIGRKLIQLFLTLLAVVTFNFLLFRVLPGDPIQLYARSGRLTPAAADQLRALQRRDGVVGAIVAGGDEIAAHDDLANIGHGCAVELA